MKHSTQDYFQQGLDHILREGRLPHDASGADRQDLETAQALAAADFSDESRIRGSLRARLLERSTAAKTSPRQARLPRWALALALAAVLLFAASPMGTSFARSLVQAVREWRLGEHSTAVSVDGDFEAVPGENGETIVLPAEAPVEDSGGVPPPVEDGERRLVMEPGVPLDQAQAQVKFDLKAPTYLPEGYRLNGVIVIRAGQASVEYFNLDTARLIGLLQTAVGGEDGEVQVTFTSDMIVEDTAVNGIPALWTQSGDEGLLIWETDGVNYQLVGVADLDTALQIAESIE